MHPPVSEDNAFRLDSRDIELNYTNSKFVKIIEGISVFLVGMIPFLDFPIGLGILDSGHNMLDAIFSEERIECAF